MSSLDTRFDKFISKPSDPDACWGWLGATSRFGYGNFKVQKEDVEWTTVNAHRYSWVRERGPTPPGLRVLHECDNPPCCHPRHLFLGTQKDNVQDCAAKGRLNCEKVGEGNPSAKLNEEEVSAIRGSNLSCRALGRHYGVSRSLISQIKLNQVWKHTAA